MIGLIWNCRGVSKKGMCTGIRDLLSDCKADFVGLQETMKKNTRKKFLGI
jgi:endonuclease/exonuclease/phosphatase family metal-dependent hydrolase